ncbi:hypothetical protein SCO12_05910 [Legionella pneumophila serogroup 10]
MKTISALSLALLSSMTFAKTKALFFEVTPQGSTLVIKPALNNFYPSAGIQITSAGFSLPTNAGCVPHANGYCLFPTSPTSPATIQIKGSGSLTFKLCLNGQAKINCQNYNINQKNCNTGKRVLGSDACWIKQEIPVSTIILRCSTVCANAGLMLQQPGPTNSATLAGNVCAAFGYTDPPVEIAPGNITFIGQANQFGPTSCVWENLTGTNWDNPNNTDYSGATGNYICPCI